MAALAAPLTRWSSVSRLRQSAAAASSDPIVVVGAGLAGLRTAGLLRQAGRRVLVLEARGSPGGRVRTMRTPFDEGLHAEAGPIRIAGVHRTVLRLAQEHGLNLVPFVSSNGSSLVNIGAVTRRAPEGLKELQSTLALKPEEAGLGQGGLLQHYVGDLPGDIADLTPTAESYARWQDYDRVTWPEWLRSRGASTGAIALMTLGGDSRTLSALYVLRQFALLQNTQQFYKIQGGMDRLPRAMANSLGTLVRYNTVVVRVDHSVAAIRLDCLENGRTKRTIQASRVVFAIPFSTLRQIEIRPAFSGPKARAIEELPYFPATRFLLQSRTRFWEASGLTGSARTDQPAEIWDCTHDLPATRGILGATVGGEINGALAALSRERAVTFGAELIAKTFPDFSAHFEKGTVYRWALDPWSRGAFAVFHPGQMTTIMPDISLPEDRVHFAGEHTSSWMGWMEGALESGERAASEILTGPLQRRDALT